MKRALTVAALVLTLGTTGIGTGSALAQTDPSGHWEGSFTQGNEQIGLTLDLARSAKSEWVASMGVPAQNAGGLLVQDIAVNGNSVKFVAVELMMARFDLTLGPDGRLKGTFGNPQHSMPIEFTRTGEAKVELMPPSPAVSKELEGDWEGTLDMGGQALRIGIRFRNQPDRTVAGTIDVNMAGNPVPLNDIKQAGQSVVFGVRVAHGSFQGTLNREGTELAGQFTHDGAATPLTLRKK